MKELFLDIPEAIESAQEILNKIEAYPLAREVLLPAYDIPTEFVDPLDETDGGKRGENAYLRHLTYIGAEKRYPEITDEIRERLDFELKTVEKTGYPGYFLIVQDFCQAARDMAFLLDQVVVRQLVLRLHIVPELPMSIRLLTICYLSVS